ncbi:MAG: hypothetical protein PUE08_08610 [Eubacteriales bacterium]|nr:hypothetical protein [Eubacteriales bacterium]
MPKINSTNAKELIIKFIVKVILSTTVSIVVLNSLFSFLLLKLDIDLNFSKYIGVFICLLTAIIVSYISVGGFKSNLLFLSIISVLPLLILVITNFCINNSEAVFVIIKIAVVLISSVISSFLRLKSRKR